jgi:hypothetical protein
VEAEPRPAQIRLDTITTGALDRFITHVNEETTPIHATVGWPSVASWGTRPQNECMGSRPREDAADLEAQTKAFRRAVEAAGITLGTSVATMAVRAEVPVDGDDVLVAADGGNPGADDRAMSCEKASGPHCETLRPIPYHGRLYAT